MHSTYYTTWTKAELKRFRRMFYEPLEYPPINYNTTRKPQVVTATINSALSRQREPESDPVRLQEQRR